MDEEEAEDDVDSPGAFLASGEVSGRAMTMAMAAAALGVEQIERRMRGRAIGRLGFHQGSQGSLCMHEKAMDG